MLYHAYNEKKDRIKSRLNDFRIFYNNPVSWFYDNELVLKDVDIEHNERLFEELVFCILTANTSAIMGIKAVDAIRDILTNGSLKDIQEGLKKAGYRFPNKRAEYIIEARNKNINFNKLIEFMDKYELRDYFVENVKGIGYKEASHFLRNIGVFGLAILDKHILNSLKEHGVINEIPKSLNRKKYLEIEQKYIEFSKEVNINMDELDLLLWSMKTKKILK